jgi:hypothetical protein
MMSSAEEGSIYLRTKDVSGIVMPETEVSI